MGSIECCLCEALLHFGDWNTAHLLLKKLPEQSVMVNERIARALCRLLHTIIEPVYRLKCALSCNIKGHPISNGLSKLAPAPVTTITPFPCSPLWDPRCTTIPFCCTSFSVWCALFILTEMIVDPMNPPAPGTKNEQLYCNIITLLDASILPALSYMDCNCCVAEEIWSIVKLYSYQHRFSLYAHRKNDTYQLQPKLLRRRANAPKQIKALMKRHQGA